MQKVASLKLTASRLSICRLTSPASAITLKSHMYIKTKWNRVKAKARITPKRDKRRRHSEPTTNRATSAATEESAAGAGAPASLGRTSAKQRRLRRRQRRWRRRWTELRAAASEAAPTAQHRQQGERLLPGARAHERLPARGVRDARAHPAAAPAPATTPG